MRLNFALLRSDRHHGLRRVSSSFKATKTLQSCFSGSAPAARPRDSAVAALTHGEASFSWEVAQETGEEQREKRDGGPADAAARLSAGEGLVGARVLVVAGAVVEQPLDAADAGGVLHRALRRAHAPTAAHPAGWKGPWSAALRAAAPPAVLALGVHGLVLGGSGARHGHHQLGVIAQRFQLLWTELRALRLRSDDLAVAQEPLTWHVAARADPHASAAQVLPAGGAQRALPGKVRISQLRQQRKVAEVVRPLLRSLRVLDTP